MPDAERRSLDLCLFWTSSHDCLRTAVSSTSLAGARRLVKPRRYQICIRRALGTTFYVSLHLTVANRKMSLAAGPGRGGGGAHGQLPEELQLVVEKHVAYIQSLDTV